MCMCMYMHYEIFVCVCVCIYTRVYIYAYTRWLPAMVEAMAHIIFGLALSCWPFEVLEELLPGTSVTVIQARSLPDGAAESPQGWMTLVGAKMGVIQNPMSALQSQRVHMSCRPYFGGARKFWDI